MRQLVTSVGGLMLGAGLLGAGLLAGCSAGAGPAASPGAGPAASPGSPTATATPTAAPAATAPATGAVMDLSDPELGIVFDAAPAVTGDAADVYNWIATFEKESWRAKATGQLSPAMEVIASAEVKAQEQSAVTTNTTNGNSFGGVIGVRVGGVSVDGDAARGTACRNFAQVTFTDAGGPDTPEQAGFGQPRLMELTLTRVSAESRWKVETLKENGTC